MPILLYIYMYQVGVSKLWHCHIILRHKLFKYCDTQTNATECDEHIFKDLTGLLP